MSDKEIALELTRLDVQLQCNLFNPDDTNASAIFNSHLSELRKIQPQE